MSDRDRSARLDSFSYIGAVMAGLFAAAFAEAVGLDGIARYALAFVFLTLTVFTLLVRSTSSSHYLKGFSPALFDLHPEIGAEPAPPRRMESGAELFRLTRRNLGLDLAEARSQERGSPQPSLWVPVADAPRRIFFRAAGSSLIVGAEAEEPDARIARIDFPEFRSVYVPLRDLEDHRAGEATVPNLARDFVDQVIAIEWLQDVAELSGRDARGIAASVGYANHAGKRAWIRVSEELPADDPVRAAIAAAAE